MLSSTPSPSATSLPTAMSTSPYAHNRAMPSDVTLPFADSPASMPTTTVRETERANEQTTPPTTATMTTITTSKSTTKPTLQTSPHLHRSRSMKEKMKKSFHSHAPKDGHATETPPRVPSKADSTNPTPNLPPPPPPPTEKPFSLSNITRKARKPSISSLTRSASLTSKEKKDRKERKDQNEHTQVPDTNNVNNNTANATPNPLGAKPPFGGHKPSHSRGLSFVSIRSLKSKSIPDRINETTNESEGASTRSSKSLRARASFERLAASVKFSNSGGGDEEVPPVPRPPSHILRAQGQAQKKDELWTVFRSLDDDAQKFQSKSANLKANMIRTSLLPVLSRIAHHPSNNSLRPEDLDRRVSILNKWWLVLFETVNWNNNNGQQVARPAVTGADRPVYFDALSTIMARPEWNYPTCSHASSASLTFTTTSGSEGSTNSANSEFLVESIHHNVRTTYAHNLLVQLTYCFDRLSLRNASSSLINFSAKTFAYAFFYCPHVGEMLARLWKLPPDMLRRVFSIFDQTPDMKERQRTSEEIASHFPSACRPLTATSHVAISRHLRQCTASPPDVSQANWFGPWQSRWSARESDLFFSFAKQFYLLVMHFIPSNTPSSKLIYVPGLAAVHAQILCQLQSSLARVSNPHLEITSGVTFGTPTFDDLLPDADVPTPFARSMSNRVISENRSLLFLRDIVVDQSLEQPTKLFFVETICELLKAVARKTSLFDHTACGVLLDIVQAHINVIAPLVKEVNRPDLVDWTFWLDVTKQMLQSSNSATEFRVIAFWYSAWDDICEVPNGKEQLCYGLILNDAVFYNYFNHWSAMVRAYFHRLICWRLARYDGQAGPLETQLYLDLRRKLNTIYEFCEAYEETEDNAQLITVPSNPAPSCRLAIEKFDANPTPSSLFVCLDHLAPSPSRNDHLPSHHPPKSRWNAIKSIFTMSSSSAPSSNSRLQSPSQQNLNHEQTPDPPSEGSRRAIDYSSPLRLQSETLSSSKCHFQFTLQPVDRNRFANYNPRLLPPPLPIPLRLYLQSLNNQGNVSPEKSWLSAKTDSETETPGTQDTFDSPATSSGTDLTRISPHMEPENDACDTQVKQENSPARSTPANGEVQNDESPADGQNHHPTTSPQTPAGTAREPTTSSQEKARTAVANNPGASKYAGRSLSEWCLVVAECDNHHERRREAGVTSNQQVEIPMLAADLKR